MNKKQKIILLRIIHSPNILKRRRVTHQKGDLLPTFQKNGKNSIQIEIDTGACVPRGREKFFVAADSGINGETLIAIIGCNS